MYPFQASKSCIQRHPPIWCRADSNGDAQRPYPYSSWTQVSSCIDFLLFPYGSSHPFRRDTPLPLISQSLTYVADDVSKLPSLLQYLSQPYDPPVLVFVSSQERATSLAEELVLSGTPNVDHLHAGMTKKEREDAVSRMRKGESWVMITTEVMARGMDFKGVREVINYDFPQSVQSYIHRVGEYHISYSVFRNI